MWTTRSFVGEIIRTVEGCVLPLVPKLRRSLFYITFRSGIQIRAKGPLVCLGQPNELVREMKEDVGRKSCHVGTNLL